VHFVSYVEKTFTNSQEFTAKLASVHDMWSWS